VNFGSFCVTWAAVLAALFVGERKPNSWQFWVSESERTREKNCQMDCEAIETKGANVKLPDCDNNWAIR
jgi:hypothetical protein